MQRSIAAKAVAAKIIRGEGVTPITTGGLVALPRDAEWRADFITELSNFPVGVHDDVCDAFFHAIKAFTTERDFKTPDLRVIPGRWQSEEDARLEQLREDWEWENEHRIGGDWDL